MLTALNAAIQQQIEVRKTLDRFVLQVNKQFGEGARFHLVSNVQAVSKPAITNART